MHLAAAAQPGDECSLIDFLPPWLQEQPENYREEGMSEGDMKQQWAAACAAWNQAEG